MFESYVNFGLMFLAVLTVFLAAGVLHSQIRMRRHLSRLRRVPLETGNDRR